VEIQASVCNLTSLSDCEIYVLEHLPQLFAIFSANVSWPPAILRILAQASAFCMVLAREDLLSPRSQVTAWRIKEGHRYLPAVSKAPRWPFHKNTTSEEVPNI
jgi:hypothetical protein